MMMEKKFSGTILQPHDTPLGEMNHRHREILGQILQLHHGSNSSLARQREGDKKIYPVYPGHCLVQPDLSIDELKKKITKCSIHPPTYKNGFLYRPVEMEGARPQPLPQEILRKILPFLAEEKLEHTEIPGGFIFGYIRKELFDKIDIKELSTILGKVKTLNLRVFRLHEIEYTWTLGEIPGPLCWTMELPRWVKLK